MGFSTAKDKKGLNLGRVFSFRCLLITSQFCEVDQTVWDSLRLENHKI